MRNHQPQHRASRGRPALPLPVGFVPRRKRAVTPGIKTAIVAEIVSPSTDYVPADQWLRTHSGAAS
jgi:hypothetical protein